jgi:hypothetical protein
VSTLYGADPSNLIFANSHPEALFEVTGRMRGYTDELDWVERCVSETVETIHERVAARGKAPITLTFAVTRRSVIGSRGWFTKRNISKYEYEIVGSEDMCRVVATLVSDLVRRIS